jgi:hypothetical protein
MRYLNKIAADGQQKFFLTGNPGPVVTMDLRYLPTQELWMMGLERGDFKLGGIIVTASPNILRNYKNIIPFGIACTTVDGLDPYFIDDFSEKKASLYLLSAAEVEEIEEGYF